MRPVCSQLLIPEEGCRRHTDMQDQYQAGRWTGSMGISTTEFGNKFALRTLLFFMIWVLCLFRISTSQLFVLGLKASQQRYHSSRS